MRDACKQHRQATAEALSGNTGGIPVYDEKRWVQDTDSTYVLLSTQQQTPIQENDCTWISLNSLDIEIYQRTGSEVSKDEIDDIANTVLGILIPTPGVCPLTAGNLQFGYAQAESIISRNMSLSETESIVVKVIRFTVQITQQI